MKILKSMVILMLICVAAILWNATTTEAKSGVSKDGWAYIEYFEGELIVIGVTKKTNGIVPDTINGMPVTEIFEGLSDEDDGYIHCTFKKLASTSLVIPEGVKSVYLGNTSFASVIFPASAEKIELSYLVDIKKLIMDQSNQFYTVHENILYTKDLKALEYCPKSKKEVTVPDGVERISPLAFMCGKQKKVILPESLKEIDTSAFEYSDLEEIVLPEGLIKIGIGAFLGTKIKTIEIPASVSSIEDTAFATCKNLTSVKVKCKVIGEKMFANCENLKKVTLSSKVEEIGIRAFERCNFNSITISENVKKIDFEAFVYVPLKKITIRSNVLVKLGEGAFSQSRTTHGIAVLVPKSKLEDYKKLMKRGGLFNEYNKKIDDYSNTRKGITFKTF